MPVAEAPAAMDILYGGTFDPPHRGHERFVDLLRTSLPQARVHLLPCYQPVHKTGVQAGPDQRLVMTEALASGWPDVSVDERELRSQAPKYTVETLADWRGEVGPDRPLAFAIGGDSLAGLQSWRDWQSLLELAHLLVLPRPGVEQHPSAEVSAYLDGHWLSADRMGDLLARPAGCIVNIPGQALAWSSTAIRQGRANLEEAVPARVLYSINELGVY